MESTTTELARIRESRPIDVDLVYLLGSVDILLILILGELFNKVVDSLWYNREVGVASEVVAVHILDVGVDNGAASERILMAACVALRRVASVGRGTSAV